MATVLVDGENVRRSLWPNMSRAELVDRSYAWAEREGHEVSVIWEGPGTADDEIVALSPRSRARCGSSPPIARSGSASLTRSG